MNNNKFVLAVASTVIMVVLITTVLIPIIGSTSTGTETKEQKDGAYGPSLTYQSTPESTDSSYFYIDARLANDEENIRISTGVNGNFTTDIYLSIADLADKTTIIYSDNYTTIYIEDNNYKFTNNSGDSWVNDLGTVPISSSIFVQKLSNNTMNYKGSVKVPVNIPPTYYYAMTGNGEYSNFIGDNAPTMDTPSVSVTGAYIGERYTTVIEKSQYAAILEVIPILMLVGVLVAVVTMSIKKQ